MICDWATARWSASPEPPFRQHRRCTIHQPWAKPWETIERQIPEAPTGRDKNAGAAPDDPSRENRLPNRGAVVSPRWGERRCSRDGPPRASPSVLPTFSTIKTAPFPEKKGPLQGWRRPSASVHEGPRRHKFQKASIKPVIRSFRIQKMWVTLRASPRASAHSGGFWQSRRVAPRTFVCHDCSVWFVLHLRSIKSCWIMFR